MRQAVAGLIVILAAGCGRETQRTQVADQMPASIIEIAAESCIDVCEGRICYMNVKPRINKSGLAKGINNPLSYSIAAEGFGDYFRIGDKMIFADNCVLYKKSAGADKLVLELLKEQ